jgi:hypothetical protein
MRNRDRRSSRLPRSDVVVLFACAASAGAHAGLVPAHLSSEPRLGVAFMVAVGLLTATAVALGARPRDRRTNVGAALLMAGLIGAYIASRTTGIPLLQPEPEAVDAAGIATGLVEAIGVAFALWKIQADGPLRKPSPLQEVLR